MDDRRPAAPWRRLVARCVDLVTVFFCLFVLALLGGGAVIDGATQARIAFVVLLAGYEVVFVAALGQTPGKDLLRVKVAAPGTADAPSFGRAAVRWLLPGLVVLVPDPALAAAALLTTGATSLLRADRRAVHDLVARTWVVAYDADEEEEVEPVDTIALERLRSRQGIFRRLFDDSDPPRSQR